LNIIQTAPVTNHLCYFGVNLQDNDGSYDENNYFSGAIFSDSRSAVRAAFFLGIKFLIAFWASHDFHDSIKYRSGTVARDGFILRLPAAIPKQKIKPHGRYFMPGYI
jgi:hypothetical protein